MPSLITQVKSKLFIHSTRKSLHALDGAYASLLRGRSLDFEDLRKYEYGDQVRDIDWRATARLGTPLVKRSRATRMHTVLFVVDTGRSMSALAADERSKKELAILATGLYGEAMPKQNGAPIRLVVPWKYGFKSIKSVVKITLTDRQPQTSWEMLQPSEYGFYANVNPTVDHPRWSQASERRIGAGLLAGREETLMFNGYGDQVASLYAGMDLAKNY